jgi:NAD(P)H-quinone oxidoreductase subunit 5
MNPFSPYAFLIFLSLFNPIISLCFIAVKRRWEIANISALIGLITALLIWLMTIFKVEITSPFALLHFTPVTSTVLLLVHFIGYVVFKYAMKNFELDQDNKRFLQWFLTTIFAVMLTLASNHLLLFWLGWVSVSISLHQLLMFYPQRYRAALAAHKKFIFARMAEVFLAAAFLLIYFEHGSGYIDDILAQYPVTSLSFNLHIATVLIAMVVLIKCAQLPLHGWLVQVVESPTPVSALLHAGIINMGGMLLLVFAPIFSQSLPAQILVLVFATSSAVLASLVMMSITSVKVKLAWSTIAQMGLMLIECALGLYEIALLHLLAHSVYKAHAFLSAGEAVNHHILQNNLQVTSRTLDWQLAFMVSAIGLITAIYFGLITAPYSPWVILSSAVIVMMAIRNLSTSPFNAIMPALGLTVAYLIFKTTIGNILITPQHQFVWQLDLIVSLLFVSLLVAYVYLFVVQQQKLSGVAMRLLNAGFYLDEWSTRITLNIWPIKLPKKQPKHQLHKVYKHDISNQTQSIS